MTTPDPDDPLVRAFEAAAVDPATFGHREHLYVAWWYLSRLPLEEALARYVRHLRRLTEVLGVPDKYHATITWTWMLVVHGAMQEPRLQGCDFETLLREVPALLQRGTLLTFYDRSELDSDEARRRFVLPRARLSG